MASVRLQDVAELAGVSMKTVSNVVHDYPHVSDRMRERVQRAIDELGYKPNLLGRRLATGRTGLLALAFADVTLPYFAELARRVSDIAEEHGYRVLLEQTDGVLERERAVVSGTEAGMVDGILFQPSVMSSTELAKAKSQLPMVLLGEVAAPLSVDRVMIDNVAAARTATAHLIALGRRRVAFAGHEHDHLSRTSELRIAGYQSALEGEGIAPDPALLVPSQGYSPVDRAAAIGAALDAGLDVDAIMCRDDLAAIGALRALQERGLRVPTDVAITGWDNTLMTSVAFPSITSIAPDLTALATRAIVMLRERIEGLTTMGRHELVDYELILRESAPAA